MSYLTQNKFKFCLLILAVISLLMGGCGKSKVVNDLSNTSYQLLNQDSTGVNFIQDLKGHYTVLSFVYTHCPFMCHLITANMSSIEQKLKDKNNIQFVEVSFDPVRDTPARLRKYMHRYKLNMNKFTMLTGDSLTIDSVMHEANIKYWVSRRIKTDSGKTAYKFKHTNRIEIVDPRGRVRFKYPGSKVPPGHVIKDLNKLRGHKSNTNSRTK